MNLKEKYLILMMVTLLVAAGFFAYSSWMLKTSKSSINSLDKKIKKNQEQLNSAEVLSEELAEVSKVILNSITEDKKFAASEINTFAQELTALADKYQIAVYSITPKDAYNQGHLVEHSYAMEINCTYVQMGRFLSKLESFDQIIKIRTLDVKPIREDKKIVNDEKDLITRYRVILELSTFKVLKEA